MHHFTLLVLAAWAVTHCVHAAEKETEKAAPKSPLDFTLKANDGTDHALSQYKGKVVLLVNVASKCGFTPQYKNLEEVYAKYKDQGLVVVGVPCNDFGAQEPGTDIEIRKFCTDRFKVTFPLMSKVRVQGEQADPLYKYLTVDSPKPGKITWNFEKFLIGRDGKVVDRFAPKVKPDDAETVKAVEDALKAKP